MSDPIDTNRCPVCTGQGIVVRPPWVAGDVPSWVANNTATYRCKACQGTGMVLRDQRNTQT